MVDPRRSECRMKNRVSADEERVRVLALQPHADIQIAIATGLQRLGVDLVFAPDKIFQDPAQAILYLAQPAGVQVATLPQVVLFSLMHVKPAVMSLFGGLYPEVVRLAFSSYAPHEWQNLLHGYIPKPTQLKHMAKLIHHANRRMRREGQQMPFKMYK